MTDPFAFLFIGLFLGSIVGCFLYRRADRKRIADLEFDKEMLLDFNERLLRDKEEVEYRYEQEARSYIRHLDSHRCVFVPSEDEVLEAEFVE